MAQKPEIQYVGQFYIHGSEAKELAQKNEQKKAKTKLPQQQIKPVRKIHVDLLAIGSICLAAVLLVTMVAGAMSLQSAWQELNVAQQYVYELQNQNLLLESEYHAGYDLEEVRSAALALGMIPEEEAAVMALHVTVPVQEQEPTLLEDIVWFLEGLFA